MNLLHLISQQTVQNLLPILALQPQAVIHVHSQGEQFEEAARRIESAVDTLFQQGIIPCKPEFFSCAIDSPHPTVDEARRKVGDSLALWPGCVVNLTGGTKPMSIGAFLSAEYQMEPSIYCDTQKGAILSTGKYNLSTKLPPLRELAKKLTVEVLLAAHGLPPDQLVTEPAPHPELVDFARVADRWKVTDPAAFQAFSNELRSRIYPDNKNKLVPKSAVDRILSEGLPAPRDDAQFDFLAAAARAGLAREITDGKFGYQLEERTSTTTQRLRSLQRITNQLTGGWFEVLIFDEMCKSGRYADVRRGVQSHDQKTGIGEIDLVAIDIEQCSLAFVSCKLSETNFKPLEHILSIKQRALQFGGAFAKAILSIHEFAKPQNESDLRNYCKTAGVQLNVTVRK